MCTAFPEINTVNFLLFLEDKKVCMLAAYITKQALRQVVCNL